MDKMDWKKVVSESPIDWDAEKKDIICENLITLKNDKIIKKYTKKLFEIAQQLLSYKNEIVNDLMVNNNTSAGKELHEKGRQDEKINELNTKIIQLEDNKIQNEIKMLELNNEIDVLQTKIKNLYHDKSLIGNSGSKAMIMMGDDKGAAAAGEVAAEDSPDVLSEVDREEELFKNINMKNKHIKKLLKDIEHLERKNIEKSKTINDLQTKLYDISGNLTTILAQNTEKQLRIADQDNIIIDLNETIENLNNYIERYVKENCQLEQEVNSFSKQLEERAMQWKQTIQDKETQLLNLQMKYEKMLEQNPGYDIDMERIEFKRLCETLKERNQLIDELQLKLMHTTNEMIASTKFMNALAQERETKRGGGATIKDLKTCCFCDETKELLNQSNKRCKDLQEMMIKTEEENVYKSKQAMNALEILQNYQSGDPGLAKLLKNNSELEYKIETRDKQIKTLIMELNSLQDTAQENYTLRKQLGIPENMNIIPKNSYMAKEKRFQKVINRLIQKLRASEEMRLQLKLEKNTLKRSMTRRTPKGSRENIMENDDDDDVDDDESTNDSDVSFTSQISNNNNNNNIEIKFCEHCLKQYEIMDLFRSCKNCTMKQNSKFCTNCCDHFKIGQSKMEKDNELNAKLTELDRKYTEVIDENENLRIGLHEIVEKLRDYDANSTNITIDTVTVERLLHALDARSVSGWYHPAMRIQNELIASKEREFALKERLKFNETIFNRGNEAVIFGASQTHMNIDRNPILQSNELAAAASSSNNQSIERLNSEHTIQEQNETQQYRPNSDYFQIFLGHIEERDREMNRIRQQLEEITTNYRQILLETIELNAIIKENPLDNEIDMTANDKIQLDKCNKKLEFLTIDYDSLLNSHRQSTDQYNLIMYELKKELCDTKHLIAQLRVQLKQSPFNPPTNNEDEDIKLKEEIAVLKLQLSKLSSQFFMNIKNFTIDTIEQMDFMKIKMSTIINGNLTLEFITRDELNQLHTEKSDIKNELEQLQLSNEHLTNRIKLQQEQLQSQQHSIRKRTEEEIHLKHVLVDLQCENMEKFIIAKRSHDIEQLKMLNMNLEKSLAEVTAENQLLNDRLKNQNTNIIEMNDRFTNQINNYDLKLRFLKKSLINLQQNYNEFIPLYSIVDFIKDYSQVLKKQQNNVINEFNRNYIVEFEHSIKSIIDQFQRTTENDNLHQHHIEDKINAMKYQSQCNYLEKQLRTSEEQITNLYELLEKEKLKAIQWSQHWHTIELLFNENLNAKTTIPDESKTPIISNLTDKETQTIIIENHDRFTETDDLLEESLTSDHKHQTAVVIDIPKNNETKINSNTIVQNQFMTNATIDLPTYKSMESQLKQALILASTRSSLLLDTENRLVEMQSKNKMLEKLLETKEAKIRQDKEKLKNLNGPQNTITNAQNDQGYMKKDDGILSETINSLQMLLIEKDQSIVRYQELLKVERDDLMKSYNEYRQDANKLQSIIQDLEFQVQSKEKNIHLLTQQLSEPQITNIKNHQSNAVGMSSTTAIPVNASPPIKVATSSNEYSQLSDKFIEDMFRNDQQNIFEYDDDDDVDDDGDHKDNDEKNDNVVIVEHENTIKNLEFKLKQCEIDKEKIQNKLNEMNKREKFMESRCLEKEQKISELNERLNNQQMECINITENIANHREIDQLKEFLQEKDKHIQDLTDTLKHFHDDQQQFINDTTLDTVEQVTQLNADLNRSVATNRILTTQIEALKRQITNIGQRETQARDLIKTLKNQLIKRPVISIKQTDRNQLMLMNTTREEHLQKRIEQLEHEINVCRDELDKQIKLASVRRNRDTAELGLWERQKRSQQISEKLKLKLNERDGELEKLRNNFSIAKNTITRLEREKLILENRLKNHGINVRGLQQQQRYCQTPSCPNIHTTTHHIVDQQSNLRKTSFNRHHDGSNSSSIDIHHNNNNNDVDDDDDDDEDIDNNIDENMIPEKQSNANQDIINLLKSRIESQQRKIIAMELEGKGTNQLTIEFEKLQKKIATIEAQNLRLEAKNLQYQLDLDMLRQNDFSKRTNQQIKHLEDYILSLKEELSRANALILTKNSMDENRSGSGGTSSNILNMQQTILALRRVIERLKVENKNLKDGKLLLQTPNFKSNGINGGSNAAGGSGISKEKYDKLRMEYNKIQQLYSEALDKISALQIELEIQNVTCNLCKDKIEKSNGNNASPPTSSVQPGDVMMMTMNTKLNAVKMELQMLKEKLIQKTQLLEKAKILLTRAAAKDKHLREQTIIWKRRCSELQNVPVIDEASE